MKRYPGLFALTLVATLGVTACDDGAPTDLNTQPTLDAAADMPLFGLDAAFARTAEEVPGFAGAYRDDAGRLVIKAVEGADVAAVRRGVRQHLELPAAPGRDGFDGQMMSLQEDMIVEKAAYGFASLVEFRGRANAVLGLPGAVYTDIDERTNVVRIGIEPGADASAFRAALDARGIPESAVEVVVTEPIVPLKGQTLRDRVQPIGGGVQLIFPNEMPGYVSLCTLGFNVDGPEPGRNVNYFVTNSHCTLDQGELDGTPYWQSSLSAFDIEHLIAQEVQDPGYFPCYGGAYVCRYSDASMARYETDRTPVDHDAIYRPESVNTGSLTIDPRDKKFRITNEAPYALGGEMLSKVGRTSGWTRGPVIATCLNVLQSGSNRVILCQDYVAAGVAGGDSGSPVFMEDGSDEATLYGVLWGGGSTVFVYSPMENIRYELGPFDLY